MRLHGQAVKTSPFHGGNPGSIPGGVTKKQTPIYRVSVFCYSAKKSERVATSNPLFAKALKRAFVLEELCDTTQIFSLSAMSFVAIPRWSHPYKASSLCSDSLTRCKCS